MVSGSAMTLRFFLFLRFHAAIHFHIHPHVQHSCYFESLRDLESRTLVASFSLLDEHVLHPLELADLVSFLILPYRHADTELRDLGPRKSVACSSR